MCKGKSKVKRPYVQKKSDNLNLVALVGKESDEELESVSDLGDEDMTWLTNFVHVEHVRAAEKKRCATSTTDKQSQ